MDEKNKLFSEVDKQLEDFMNGLEKKKYAEGWPENRWQEEMEKHPFFIKKSPEPGEELHPLLEGIQQLKYDPLENTPGELALAYKEDGNFNFKHKNYRLAIISYTEGLKAKCKDGDILCSLHNNRSAANYYLKNYRSSLMDCKEALKIKPNYDKVLERAAKCCFHIELYQEVINYCDILLQTKIGDKSAIMKLQNDAIQASKIKSRDDRKRDRGESMKRICEKQLFSVLAACGASFDTKVTNIETIRPIFPQLASYTVHLNQDGELVWPVVIMYPEFGVMDFVQEFNENQTLNDVLLHMFVDKPEWDKNGTYTANSITVYYKNVKKNITCTVEKNVRLGEILMIEGYVITNGTPSFLAVLKNSAQEKLLSNK